MVAMKAPRPDAVMFDGERILVVDDDELLVDLIAGVLADDGAVTVGAMSAPEALRKLSASPFDLVISDVQMPDIDGFEFGRSIKAAGIKVKLMYISGQRISPRDGIIAAQIGACDYLEKPMDGDQIRFFVHRAIKSGRFVADRHNGPPSLDDEQIEALISFLRADTSNKLAVRISKDLERLSKKRNQKALPGYLQMVGPYVETAIKEVIKRIVDAAF